MGWKDNISTHSLTRRLTEKAAEAIEEERISTHSLTRRLTEDKKILKMHSVFQLTASQGG